MNRVALTAAALAGAAMLSGCTGGRAAAERAHSRGVAFLVGAQNDDGSWGSFESARPGEVWLDTVASHRAFGNATSALCVMALQEPSRSDAKTAAALQRGVTYLINSPPVGRATGETFYDTWTHTYLVQAMARLHGDVRFASQRDRIASVMQREIMLLAERQSADGGWGYYDFGHSLPHPTGDQSTSFNTAAALVALREARDAGFDMPDAMIADGLKCLERLRTPSGAYIYGTDARMAPQRLYNQVKGSLGRSQSCNLALWRYERDISQEDLRTGLENLRREHHFIEIGKGRPRPHEAWYFTAGYYFLFGHYYGSLVAGALDEQSGDDYRRWLAQTMARLQDPDGSWFDFPLYGYYKCYGTAYALLTLQECLREGRSDGADGNSADAAGHSARAAGSGG